MLPRSGRGGQRPSHARATATVVDARARSVPGTGTCGRYRPVPWSGLPRDLRGI